MKLLKKKQKKMIAKFLHQKETQLTLAGIGGIAFYKVLEATFSRFPELVAIVEDLVANEDQVPAFDAQSSSDVQDAVI